MKFGAHYLPTYVAHLDGSVPEFYRHMFEQMEEMDRLGFDHIWVTEHHFSEYGGTLPHPPTFMAAIARTTQQIRLGVAINVLPLHNPIDVAESYAMVDIVSNGRLDFGVGKGSEPVEFRRFGIAHDEATQRMKEGMEVIRHAWSDDPVNFKGDLFDYENLRVLPKPVQRPHPPIWVGAARSEDSFRWAGENGYHLMTLPYIYPDPELLHGFLAAYREALTAAGHNPMKREILGKFHIYVSDTLGQAIEEATPFLNHYREVHAGADPKRVTPGIMNATEVRAQLEQGFIIAGDPKRCIDSIKHWQETLGLTSISGTFHFGGMPQELALRNIRMFRDRVMPALQESPMTP